MKKKDSKSIKILVLTQNEFNRDLPNIYIPIHSGAALSKKNLCYLRDDTGDNISMKNYLWADLTPQYWAWKNLDCDFIGINHYRRFFSKVPKIISLFSNGYLYKILNEKDIKDIFDDGYDCIVPKLYKFGKEDIKSNLSRSINSEAISEFLSITKKDFPQDFENIIILFNSHEAYMRGIFIMKKDIYNQYMEWLFKILNNFEIKHQSKIETPRFYAFLSERLLKVYLDENNIRIKTSNIYNSEGKIEIWMIKHLLTKWFKKYKNMEKMI